jgi:hypothetical protein
VGREITTSYVTGEKVVGGSLKQMAGIVFYELSPVSGMYILHKGYAGWTREHRPIYSAIRLFIAIETVDDFVIERVMWAVIFSQHEIIVY